MYDFCEIGPAAFRSLQGLGCNVGDVMLSADALLLLYPLVGNVPDHMLSDVNVFGTVLGQLDAVVLLMITYRLGTRV